MEFRYVSDVKPKDLWFIAMDRTYRSFLGVINVVFTVAIIALTFRFWTTTGALIRMLMISGCLIFPVIQPLAIYGRSVKQLESLPKRVELLFDERGVHVKSNGQHQDIKWSGIVNAIKQTNMIIIMSDSNHGYMLTNRILGDEKEEFYQFLIRKLRRKTE